MKVLFDESKVGRTLTDEYGIPPAFRVFRYAYRENADAAEALFVVSFQLKGMDGKKNIGFSRIPMRALFRFRGFLSKYWLLDESTNTCMGVYRWATVEDAERYARSIAMRFMKMRSVPGSVHWRVEKIGDKG